MVALTTSFPIQPAYIVARHHVPQNILLYIDIYVQGLLLQLLVTRLDTHFMLALEWMSCQCLHSKCVDCIIFTKNVLVLPLLTRANATGSLA